MDATWIHDGPFRGKWIRYAVRARLDRFNQLAFACDRCHVETPDPGRAGWCYRRGEPGREPGIRLCGPCVEVLRTR